MTNSKRYPETVTGQISRLLDDWLSRKLWQPIELIRLLVGDDLPAVGPAEEPYVWILRGIGTGADGAHREAALAARIGEFIDQKPEADLPGPRPEKMLYNLLSLCAGINKPDELAAELLRMLRRKKLSGEWDGMPLRSELRAAIASNQADKSLEPVWLWMAKGTPHDFLGGTPFQGFDGILLMPLPDSEDPPLDSIGEALGAIARSLDKVPGKQRIFGSLIDRASRAYSGPLLIYHLASKPFYDSWPTWARKILARRVPEEDGLQEFIKEAGVEYDRGIGSPGVFANHVATQVHLALRNRDRRAATVLLKIRRDRLRQLGLTTGEGSGLGLWIVEHIEAHNGELRVLPTAAANLTEVKASVPGRKTMKDSIEILSVEDDPLGAEWIRQAVESRIPGAKVNQINTESEFLTSLPEIAARPPSLILMDEMLRWADPSPHVPERPADVRAGGISRAGLRCCVRLAAKPETSAIPVILYTVLQNSEIHVA